MSDLIERQEIIDALDHVINNGAKNKYFDGHFITAEAMKEYILAMPSAQHDLQPTCNQLAKDANVPCKDTISRQNAIDMIMGQPPETHYPSWYAEQIKALPSAQPEIIRCGQCKYAEVADPEDDQDGYTCQFHRGSIWFSGSFCSWAERREDERNDI